MAKYEVAPTKTNMMKIKRELGFAEEGWKLLDQKRKILVVELMGLIDRTVEAQRNTEKRLSPSYGKKGDKPCSSRSEYQI